MSRQALQIEQLRAELAELAQQCQELHAENLQLAALVAADDRLQAALADCAQLRELNRVLDARVSTLIDDKNALIRRVNALERRARHV